MNTKSIALRCIVVLLAGGVTYGLCRSTPAANIPSEAGIKLELPAAVNGFAGEDQDVSKAELQILPADTKFAKKLYQEPDGIPINCQIVLAGGEKRSIHRPEICLPAQGWTKKTSEVVPVTLNDGRQLQVMKLVVSRPIEIRPGARKELTSLFLYWFVGQTVTTPYHWYRILHTDLDRIMHNVNHRWAYVIVSAPVLEGLAPNGKNQAETLQELKSFIAELAPEIMKSSVHMDQAPK